MVIEWTGFRPDLLLRLDRDAPETLGAQLQGQLREFIQSGRLATGERLPSTRRLASELGVSRGLVVDSYAQLEAEGYLDSRGGSATRVADCAVAQTDLAKPAPTPPTRLQVDFQYGEPDLEAFPMRDWLWALGEAAGRDGPHIALANVEHRGLAALREVAAGYMRRVRGSTSGPDNVVICNGFTQGAALAAGVLAGLGVDTVAAEDPGVRNADPVLRQAGHRVVPVPVDDRGIDVAALTATDARAVLVTPAHQCPTGVVLAPERRHELIAWANDRDAYIIEDDYDAEFRYDRQPVGTVQGLAPDRVFGISTVSKALAPGIRLGWIVCPPALVDDVVQHKVATDRGSPGLDQLALAHLIRSGRYDRHLRRMRSVYAARRETLLTAVAEHLPSTRVSGLAAGMHAVLHLPDSVDETDVVDAARARGVGLYGMRRYRYDGSTEPPQLVIGFGSTSDSAIRRGIDLVADLLEP